jgi:hypothetical protein
MPYPNQGRYLGDSTNSMNRLNSLERKIDGLYQLMSTLGKTISQNANQYDPTTLM